LSSKNKNKTKTKTKNKNKQSAATKSSSKEMGSLRLCLFSIFLSREWFCSITALTDLTANKARKLRLRKTASTPSIVPSLSPSIVSGTTEPTTDELLSDIVPSLSPTMVSGDGESTSDQSPVSIALDKFDVRIEISNVPDEDDISTIINEMDRITALHLTGYFENELEGNVNGDNFGFISLSIQSFRQEDLVSIDTTSEGTNERGRRLQNGIASEATFVSYAIFFGEWSATPTTEALNDIQKRAFTDEGLSSYEDLLRASSNSALKNTDAAIVSIRRPLVIDDDQTASGDHDGGDEDDNTLIFGGIAAAAAIVVVILTVVYVWKSRNAPKTVYTRDTTDVSAMASPSPFDTEDEGIVSKNTLNVHSEPMVVNHKNYNEETQSVISESQSMLGHSVMSGKSYDYSMDGYSFANRTKFEDEMSLVAGTVTREVVPDIDEMTLGSIQVPKQHNTVSEKAKIPSPNKIVQQESIGLESIASYVEDAEIDQDDGSVWTYSKVGGAPLAPEVASNHAMKAGLRNSLPPRKPSPPTTDKKSNKFFNIGRPVAQMSMSMKSRERSENTFASLDPSVDPSIISLDSADLVSFVEI